MGVLHIKIAFAAVLSLQEDARFFSMMLRSHGDRVSRPFCGKPYIRIFIMSRLPALIARHGPFRNTLCAAGCAAESPSGVIAH